MQRMYKGVEQHREPKRGHRERRIVKFSWDRKVRATRFLDFSLVMLFKGQHTNIRNLGEALFAFLKFLVSVFLFVDPHSLTLVPLWFPQSTCACLSRLRCSSKTSSWCSSVLEWSQEFSHGSWWRWGPLSSSLQFCTLCPGKEEGFTSSRTEDEARVASLPSDTELVLSPGSWFESWSVWTISHSHLSSLTSRPAYRALPPSTPTTKGRSFCIG